MKKFTRFQWEWFFNKDVLVEGYLNYDTSKNYKVKKKHDVISAVINDNIDYHTTITMKNNTIDECSCTCEEFENYGECSHMVELCCAYCDMEKNVAKIGCGSLKYNIDNINEDDLRGYVYEYAVFNPKFAEDFNWTFFSHFDEEFVSSYFLEVSSLINDYLMLISENDEDDFSELEEIFLVRFQEFFESRIQILMFHERYMEAWIIAIFIMNCFDEGENFLHTTAFKQVTYICTYVWNGVLGMVKDETLKKMLLNKLHEEFNELKHEEIREIIEQLIETQNEEPIIRESIIMN